MATAQSVAPGGFSFAFQIGTNWPQGHLADRADSGWTSSFDFTYNLTPQFRLRTEFGYSDNHINLKPTLANSVLDITGSHYNYNLTENAVYAFANGPISFYVIGGLGAYRTTLSVDQIVPVGYWDPWWGYWYGYGTSTIASRTTTKLGLNAGVGVSFKTGDAVSIFLETRYTQVQTQTTIDYIPFTVGIRF
jgi:opacity protein-like surface antigen